MGKFKNAPKNKLESNIMNIITIHYIKILYRRINSLIWFLSFVVISNLTGQTTIAVLDFEGKGLSKSEASALSDRLANEIFVFSSESYYLIEREQIEEILTEQGFQQTGCVTSECAIEVGKLLGVQQIITGSISKVGKVYSISARIIEVQTGQIIGFQSYDHRGDIGELLTYGMKNVASKLLGFQIYAKDEIGEDSFPRTLDTYSYKNQNDPIKQYTFGYPKTTTSSLIVNGGFGVYPAIKLLTEKNEKAKIAWRTQLIGGLFMLYGMSINEEPDYKGGPFIVGGWIAGIMISKYIDLTQE